MENGNGARNAIIAVIIILVLVGLWYFFLRPANNGENLGDATDLIVDDRVMVENVEVAVLGVTPATVRVVIEGNLPDGCSEVGDIEMEREGNTINLTLERERPRDAVCTQALKPFTVTHDIDVSLFTPGMYTLNVMGVTTTFELTADDLSGQGKG